MKGRQVLNRTTEYFVDLIGDIHKDIYLKGMVVQLKYKSIDFYSLYYPFFEKKREGDTFMTTEKFMLEKITPAGEYDIFFYIFGNALPYEEQDKLLPKEDLKAKYSRWDPESMDVND